MASFAPFKDTAGEDGAFTIGGVIPGTYHITATANAGGPHGDIGAASFGFRFVEDAGTPSGPDRITVGSADVTGLTVVANT